MSSSDESKRGGWGLCHCEPPARRGVSLFIEFWTNVLHAAHWSCSVTGQTLGACFCFIFYFSCTKTYSTKRICWQRWHSASKNETAKGNKRAGKALERNLWSSCSYKSPEIPTQTTARVRALKKTKKKHTYFPTSLSLSASHPHKHMYTAYRHTHTHP